MDMHISQKEELARQRKNAALKYLRQFNLSKARNLTLNDEIACGGFGTVFRVEEKWSPHFLAGRKYALHAPNGLVMKVIRTHHTGFGQPQPPEEREHIHKLAQTEVDTMKLLNSSGYTMPLLDSIVFKDQDESIFLLLMPWMESFGNRLLKETHLKESDLIQLCTDIAHALEGCHKQTVVHRDMKEFNIYCSNINGRTRYLLGDFGAARNFSDTSSDYVTYFGGNCYNQTDPAIWKQRPYEYTNDIFALCKMIRHLIDCDNVSRHEIGQRFMEILEKGTEENPKNRYSNGTELLKALDRLSSAEASRGTVIQNNRFFRQARKAVLENDYQSAEQLACRGKAQNECGCAVLELYCKFRTMIDVLNRGRGSEAMLRKLLHQATELAGTLPEQDYLSVQLMNAMLTRAMGDSQSFEVSLEHCARKSYIPALYYYGYFMCEGEIKDGFGGSLYNEGIRYLLDAANQGCIEANEYLLYQADLKRCTAEPQASIREIRQRIRENPTVIQRWKAEKRIPLLVRYI